MWRFRKCARVRFELVFQRPEEKPITSLVFRGVQGTGKGTFLHLLHALMGKTFHETADPKKDIFGTHANMIEGKKCLALNEADECIMKMYRKLLKSMLTDTSFFILDIGVSSSWTKSPC